MSYQNERDTFVALAAGEGMSMDTIHKLLRFATTLQRLAIAQCNGDYPADNGERKVKFCPRCESGFVPSSFKRASNSTPDEQLRFKELWGPGPVLARDFKICPDCRTQELVTACLRKASIDYWKSRDLATHEMDMTPRTDYVFSAVFGGDPRGAVLRLNTPKHPLTENGIGRGLYVPARER